MLAAIPFFALGGDLALLSQSAPDKEGIVVLKVLQIIMSLGLFFVPYLLFRYYTADKVYTLNWSMKLSIPLIIAAITTILALPAINYLAEWNSNLTLPDGLGFLENWIRNREADAEQLIEKFLVMDGYADLFFNLVLIAVIPAIGEELFFRGAVQPVMIKWFKNIHVAIWLTAFVFSFIHMQFLGFIPRLMIGAVFGYMAHWSGSLLLPMIGHLFNNGLAVLLVWFIGIEEIDSSAETLGANEGEWIIVLLSVTIVSFGLFVIRRISGQKKAP